MKQLLSPYGLAALAELARHRSLYAFDFDGTLAPIVWRHGEARMGTALRSRLARLAAQVPVAVISGRSLADLRSRIPDEVIHGIGNHGNESADQPEAQAMIAVCRDWIAQLQPQLAGLPDGAGIELEDKGATLSLHYRHARDREQAGAWLERTAAALQPAPRVIGGKLVLNLLPPGAHTKFEALYELARSEQAERVLFVGDDETDEIVFAQAPADWVTVRVDLHSSSRARYFLQKQSEVTILIDHLLARLASATGGRTAGHPPRTRAPH